MEIGDTVLIPVSELGRGRGDPVNLIGVVVEKKASGLKPIQVAGVLAGFFSRNQLELVGYKGVSRDMILKAKTELSVCAS